MGQTRLGQTPRGGRRSRGLVLWIVFLAASMANAPVLRADPLPAHAARVVDYSIDVRLDAAAKTLSGRERVTWTNPSTDQVPDLWFHLYLNAFRNNRSTFFRESGGQLRGVEMPQDGWGWIDVTSLRIAGGADLLPRATFERPDDGNTDDQTVLRVPLPSPVAPGGVRHPRHHVDGEATRGVRTNRLRRRLLPRRASGSRNWRSTSRRACAGERPAAGTATSSTRTPSSTRTSAAFGRHHRALSVRRRRHGPASLVCGGTAGHHRATGTSRTTCTTSRGPRIPRFVEVNRSLLGHA